VHLNCFHFIYKLLSIYCSVIAVSCVVCIEKLVIFDLLELKQIQSCFLILMPKVSDTYLTIKVAADLLFLLLTESLFVIVFFEFVEIELHLFLDFGKVFKIC